MKRIFFLGICFFLTFIAIQVVVSQFNKPTVANSCLFFAKNSTKDFNFVANGILAWEDSVQETKTPAKYGCVFTSTHSISLFSTTYTSAHRTAIFTNCSHVLQRLFVLFENFRL